jgi:ribosomal protein L28
VPVGTRIVPAAAGNGAIPLTKNLLKNSSKIKTRKNWTANEKERARENARRGRIPVTANLLRGINPPVLPENDWESRSVPITANMLGETGAGKPINPYCQKTTGNRARFLLRQISRQEVFL